MPSGNTVQQHQCGKRAILGWQTVHVVFFQTSTKSCHIANNIDEVLQKFCNIVLIKRFTLTMNPTLNCVT